VQGGSESVQKAPSKDSVI
jgi:hypothetical protein